jgi:hypothetical protein
MIKILLSRFEIRRERIAFSTFLCAKNKINNLTGVETEICDEKVGLILTFSLRILSPINRVAFRLRKISLSRKQVQDAAANFDRA